MPTLGDPPSNPSECGVSRRQREEQDRDVVPGALPLGNPANVPSVRQSGLESEALPSCHQVTDELEHQAPRTHVEYAINDAQADIVRSIFDQYGAGLGLRAIAKDLNQRGVLPPRAGRRGTGSWSTSALHAMLRRERYRGVIVWNQREKTYRKGTKVRIQRDANQWIRVDVPELRIVSDDLWFGVHVASRPTSRRERLQVGARLVTCSLASLAAPNAAGR